jgi:antitoxin ParD1/3/4
MARHLDPSSLPENVARYAQGQVDAGRFASIEDVLSAGVEALQERDQADQEWLADARKEAESGFAALDRGEGIRGTVDEHMARIDAAVRVRAAQRASK